jgi:hypothetical protein
MVSTQDTQRMNANYLLVIDVGHPPRSPKQVETELEAAFAKVRNSSRLRVIKVIHGYGSHGPDLPLKRIKENRGSIKETVRNWAFQFRKRFRAVIDGEAYAIFDDDTQAMRSECGQIDDNDLGIGNAGITLIWVK